MFGGGVALDALVADIAERAGVEAGPGGRHTTGGTHNALLGLGGDRYLELIAADPEGDPEARRGRLIAGLEAPRSICWAIAVDDLDRAIAQAREKGYDPGPAEPLSRRTPDGRTLEWRLAWQGEGVFLGILPFLIAWGDCPHPAKTAPGGATLAGLHAEHPDPERAGAQLAALDVDLEVRTGPEPRLVATLDTPRGRLVLG